MTDTEFRAAVEAAYQRMIDTPMSEDSTREFMDDIEDALWPGGTP